MENKISLSVELVNAILNYLDSKTHREVRPLIDAIQREANGQLQAPAEAPVEE